MKTEWVCLCAGQGSQYVGMGKALHDAFGRARELYQEANDALGLDLRSIAFNGPEAELTKTLNTQPALFTLDVACAELLKEAGVGFAAAAGHSLGEYAACVVAGAMSLTDGLGLTRLRGELMYRAGIERPGAMAAILGLSEEQVASVLAGVKGIVVPANLNAPSQVVISGEVEAVEAAIPHLKAAGARRAVRLPVSGAFHSPLMEPAADGLKAALDDVEITDARIPIVVNATAEPVQTADAIRVSLARQLMAPVRWEASMRYLLDAGHRRFVEVGPGTVLQGLLRKVDPAVTAAGVENPETLEAFLSMAGGRSDPVWGGPG